MKRYSQTSGFNYEIRHQVTLDAFKCILSELNDANEKYN